MSPAAVFPRVTLTIEISSVLYSALQITAAMSQETVSAVIGTVLRDSQITFFAEDGASLSDVVVLDVRDTPMSTKREDVHTTTARTRGAVQRAILGHLIDSSTISGVYDLREVRQAMPHSHQESAVSRAMHQLVRRGVLKSMMPTSNGFQPDNGGAESPVRYVRCGAGS